MGWLSNPTLMPLRRPAAPPSAAATSRLSKKFTPAACLEAIDGLLSRDGLRLKRVRSETCGGAAYLTIVNTSDDAVRALALCTSSLLQVDTETIASTVCSRPPAGPSHSLHSRPLCRLPRR